MDQRHKISNIFFNDRIFHYKYLQKWGNYLRTAFVRNKNRRNIKRELGTVIPLRFDGWQKSSLLDSKPVNVIATSLSWAPCSPIWTKGNLPVTADIKAAINLTGWTHYLHWTSADAAPVPLTRGHAAAASRPLSILLSLAFRRFLRI